MRVFMPWRPTDVVACEACDGPTRSRIGGLAWGGCEVCHGTGLVALPRET